MAAVQDQDRAHGSLPLPVLHRFAWMTSYMKILKSGIKHIRSLTGLFSFILESKALFGSSFLLARHSAYVAIWASAYMAKPSTDIFRFGKEVAYRLKINLR